MTPAFPMNNVPDMLRANRELSRKFSREKPAGGVSATNFKDLTGFEFGSWGQFSCRYEIPSPLRRLLHVVPLVSAYQMMRVAAKRIVTQVQNESPISNRFSVGNHPSNSMREQRGGIHFSHGHRSITHVVGRTEPRPARRWVYLNLHSIPESSNGAARDELDKSFSGNSFCSHKYFHLVSVAEEVKCR